MNLTATLTAVLSASAPVLAVGWASHAAVMRRRIRQARLDPLTGVATRTGWTRQAGRILHADQGAVVVLLDLDRFKEINDTLGHYIGDAVLTVTAQRLHAWCGTNGLAARLGGDEFTAILTHHHHGDVDQVDACVVGCGCLAEQVRALNMTIAAPVAGLAVQVSVSASIGYARAAQFPGADLSVLLRAADTAMYTAKLNGCGNHEAIGASYAHSTVNGRRSGRPGTTTANTATTSEEVAA